MQAAGTGRNVSRSPQKRRRNRPTQTKPRRKVGALHCHRRRLPNGPIQARFRVSTGLRACGLATRSLSPRGHEKPKVRVDRHLKPTLRHRPQPAWPRTSLDWLEGATRDGTSDGELVAFVQARELCNLRVCIVRSMLRPQHEGLVIAFMSACHKHLIAASRARRFTRHRRRTPGGMSADGSI